MIEDEKTIASTNKHHAQLLLVTSISALGFSTMPIAQLPFTTHLMFTLSKDRTRWIRVGIVTVVVVLVVLYDTLIVNPSLRPSAVRCDDSDNDLLLKLFNSTNQRWTRSPEAMPFIATGVLFTQYALAVALVFRFIITNDMIWLGILTTWIFSVILKQMVNTPLSSQAIDYAANLPYPIERAKLVTDHVFAVHFYLSILYAKYLQSVLLKWVVTPALCLNCFIVACFLLITFQTNTYALIAAAFAGFMLKEIPPLVQQVYRWLQKGVLDAWNAVRYRRKAEQRQMELKLVGGKPSIVNVTAHDALEVPKDRTTLQEDEDLLNAQLRNLAQSNAGELPDL